MTDIVQRVGKHLKGGYVGGTADELLCEAAAEIERLRAWLKEAEHECELSMTTIAQERRRAERAEAQVAALREALEQAEACMSIVEPRSDKRKYLCVLGEIRAALEEK